MTEKCLKIAFLGLFLAFGAENTVFLAVLGDFEAEARRGPLARVGGLRGEWGAPKGRASAKTRCHVPCRATGAPLFRQIQKFNKPRAPPPEAPRAVPPQVANRARRAIQRQSYR